MSMLRIVGSGIGCAVFAALGAFVGSEIASATYRQSSDAPVLGAIAGGATGAFFVGLLAGTGDRKRLPGAGVSGGLSGAAGVSSGLHNPRFP